MEVVLKIIYALLSVGLLGTLLGFGLASAARKLKVEKDKLVGELENALPGLNCGACGYAGCSGYAEALSTGRDLDTGKCKPGGASAVETISTLLGREAGAVSERMVAQVHCNGCGEKTKKDFSYRGIQDCNAASILYQGDKSCKYGCIGLGSCMKVCPVDAIFYTGEGCVSIDREKCITCGKCLDICPTGVIKLIPYDADYIIACNSRDKGKDVKAKCDVGCIGCGICARKFPDAGFSMEGQNLPVIDYSAAGSRAEAAEKCPSKCIVSPCEIKS